MASAPPWQPPAEFDDYVIVRPLGQGGMGQVYLAEDVVLARPVAIKFLSNETVASARARQRFLLEARAAARLTHPNVVAVYRVGELDERPYIISEFVRGRTLDQLERLLSFGRVLEIAVALARALAAAHRAGVLHRDLKPQNAMVADDGCAKLLDFGLAALLEAREDAAEPRARRGGIVGTPYYIAPEVWREEPASRRSDVYSLGAVLYALVAGRPPHAGTPLHELPHLTQVRDAPLLGEAS